MTDMTDPRRPDDAASGHPGPGPAPSTRLDAERAHLEEERRVRVVQQTEDPAQIREEIRMTRGRVDGTLHELEDRLSPARVAERGRARVRSRWNRLRTRVMGSVDDLTTSSPSSPGGSSSRGVGDVASDAVARTREAPRATARRTRGNPLAAGMIAFGVGTLVSALLPETDREQRLVEDAADHVDLERMRGEAEQVAQDVREPVQDRVREGVDDLKETASGHASDLSDEAKDSSRQVTDDAKRAGDHVRDHADDT